VKAVAERFGTYEIGEELGAGGLASVHLATSRAVKNPVALKRLFPHIANVKELVDSFIEEARLARHLQHPGIARVYEFGRLRGTYFIAFEFVPGPTLQQLYTHCAASGIKIPTPVVVAISAQLCDALDHAHTRRNEIGLELGVVHRDVSPSNVIVSKSGQVKLIDFGLAKTKQSTVQSQAGVIKGKLNYVAPEYIAGGKLDARCDLWALGVVMYELLAGRRLFEAGDNAVTLDRVRTMAIPPPSRVNPDVPPSVDQIVLTALEREPNRRWQSAAKFRLALSAYGGTMLSHQQLVTWIEWAFSQKQPQREDSGISALSEIIESREIEVVGELPAISAAMAQRRRESVAMMPVGAAMIQRRTAGTWIWLVVVLLMGAGAVAALLAAR
jgi:eukaryotic-like serine/threonine-protein kinase